MIGREAELEDLLGLIGRSLKAAAGHLVLVEGESGVGKSRLLHALREELLRANVGMCVGTFRRGNAPLDALREALADYWWMSGASRDALAQAIKRDLGPLGFPPDDIRRLVDFLRPLSGRADEHPDSSDEASSLFARIEQLLLRLAAVRPMTLVLEDVQYADSATLSFLEYLAVTLRAQSAPIVLVISLRSGERTLNSELERSLRAMSSNIGVGLTRMRLKRLRGRELSVLLDELLPMEARLKERVAWLCQGNPLHAMQIVGYLRGSERLVFENQRWMLKKGTPRHIDLPPDLMDLMHLRVNQAVERNPEASYLKETSVWIATLGIRVPVGLLSQVMHSEYGVESDHLSSNIDILRRYGILHTRTHQNVEVVEFDNSLLRESLLRDTSVGDGLSVQMHRRAARAKLSYYKGLDRQPPLLEIAEHWRLANETTLLPRHALRGSEALDAPSRPTWCT